jgi:hypothetical protein
MSDLIKNEDLAKTIIKQQQEIAGLKARISELERRPSDEMRLMAELRSKR